MDASASPRAVNFAETSKDPEVDLKVCTGFRYRRRVATPQDGPGAGAGSNSMHATASGHK